MNFSISMGSSRMCQCGQEIQLEGRKSHLRTYNVIVVVVGLLHRRLTRGTGFQLYVAVLVTSS